MQHNYDHHLDHHVQLNDMQRVQMAIIRYNHLEYFQNIPLFVRYFLGPYAAFIRQVPLFPALKMKLEPIAIKWLIDNGSRVNHQDMGKCSALHFVYNYSVEERFTLFKLLLSAGANVNLMTIQGETPLGLLCADPSYTHMIPILRLMLKTATKSTIDSGIRLAVENYFHISGCSNFHECDRRHSNTFESVKLLLKNGADFDVQCLRETVLKWEDINFRSQCLNTFGEISKWLIKYAILKNLEKRDYILRRLNIRDVITVGITRNQRKLISLSNLMSNYFNQCFSEIVILHADEIGHNYTLYEFLQDSFYKVYRKQVCPHKLLEVMICLNKGRYFWYQEIILRNLKRCDLLILEKKLRASLAGKVCKNTLAGLNWDCFQEIVKHLKTRELISLMAAVYGFVFS